VQVVDTEPYRMRRTFVHRPSGQVFGSLRDAPHRLELAPAALPAFLTLGYVPGTATLWADVDLLPGGCRIAVAPGGWQVLSRRRFRDEITPDAYRDASWDELVRLGGSLLVAAAADAFAAGGRPVVPLSGGLDSRALLGCLRELTESAHIETFTYGVPGGLDFEVGNRVGRWAGTRHLSLDFGSRRIDAARLQWTALRTGANTDLMQPVVWSFIDEIYGSGARYWSGYTGDGVGGSFFREDGPEAEALGYFLDFESRAIRILPGRARDDVRVASLVDTDPKWQGVMSADEAVWFENHVERYTAHHIFVDGLDYATPFMDDRFVRFLLSVPRAYRRDKRLFDAIVAARFPDLFQLPTASQGYRLARRPVADAAWRTAIGARKAVARLSRGRWTTHPGTSYLDYAEQLRRTTPLRTLVQDALAGLRGRPWIDPAWLDATWSSHQAGADRRFALTLLASLEQMLRAVA
jgi:hypothetical protein